MSGFAWIIALGIVYYIARSFWNYNMKLPPGYRIEVKSDRLSSEFDKLELVTPDGARIPSHWSYISVFGYPALARELTRAANRHRALSRNIEAKP